MLIIHQWKAAGPLNPFKMNNHSKNFNISGSKWFHTYNLALELKLFAIQNKKKDLFDLACKHKFEVSPAFAYWMNAWYLYLGWNVNVT